MVTVLREILKKMQIKTASWQKTEMKDYYQIMFSFEAGNRQRKLQNMLNDWGIGEREGSSVTMIPGTLLHTQCSEKTKPQEYDKKLFF